MNDETATPVTPDPVAASGAADEKLRYNLAMAAIVGFVAFVVALAATKALSEVVIGTIIGYFGGWITSPFGFYFGSSAGSKMKSMQGAKP